MRPKYWIADPDLRLFEVYRRDAEGRLVKVAELEDAAILSSPLFPGLEIDLGRLWP